MMCAKIKKYPEIENIVVKCKTKMAGKRFWNSVFYCNEYDINRGYIRCNNPLCQSGGVYFSGILHQMVKGGQEKNEIKENCRGQDSSGGWCPKVFKIEIAIKYKNGGM